MNAQPLARFAVLAALLGGALAAPSARAETPDTDTDALAQTSPSGAAPSPSTDSSAPAGAQAPSTAAAAPLQNRLIISGNGSTLADPSSGGGGGAVTWVHDFSSTGTLGVGGQYQTLANAHWEFGSVTGSLNFGSPADKWSIYGEADEGVGDIGIYLGLRHFDYAVEAAGVNAVFVGKVILQLETRQYDIDTAHGDLPKIGLGFLWTPHFQTTVSFAHSVTGNLGTQLTTLRLDYFGPVNWIVGGATGFAAPPIVNFQTGATGVAPTYHEGYLGLSKTLRRADWGILADYLKLGEVKRVTLTLTCTLHL
jgi:hypothetical protein